ncbi:MAG TPA: bifunctional hydroxymethylpyrimidine kinase/phosphomethylpyrimidine kinase [Terriglobia bacterium]|nr:bifunctional hydroxymethylpyrimidine kinase/phosphomethylpyrimidine kinase [Terriglobia bacterium]
MSTSSNHTSTVRQPVILTIAGFDPSAGAGIAADLKTFAAHNCYGVAAITSLTVQNTQSIGHVYPVESHKLKESLDALFEDRRISAIKVGMLGDRANAQIVSEFLAQNGSIPVVIDPILRSGTGTELLDVGGLEVLKESLLRRATVLTPNLYEAAVLTGSKVENVEEMRAAARKLVEIGARAVVVTGGHLEKAVDVYYDGTVWEAFAGDKVKPENTHGTGCTFSSAITAQLALGRQLREAVVLAKAYVTEAIRKAFAVGPGRVPLYHLYRMQQAPRTADHNLAVPEAIH